MRTNSSSAANNPEFQEDIRNFSSEEVFKIFLETPDKEVFLRESYLTIKKYIRVFLHGYNYEVDFEKKYGNIFFDSTNSVLQKGIISVFLISRGYSSARYYTYMSSLGYEQLEAVLSYFRDHFDGFGLVDNGIDPTLVQLRTRKEYLKIGLSQINKK